MVAADRLDGSGCSTAGVVRSLGSFDRPVAAEPTGLVAGASAMASLRLSRGFDLMSGRGFARRCWRRRGRVDMGGFLDATGATIAQALYQRLREKIIESDGFLPFVDVMQTLLYEPRLGYYVNGRRRFGADGDFVTAPEISPLFGATLARAVDRLCAATALPPRVFEFGPGSGRLAASLIRESIQLGRPVERYDLLEVSPDLRRAQRETLVAELGEALVDARVHWVDDWPDADFAGVILANELFDAFTVEWFVWRGRDAVPGQVGLTLAATAESDRGDGGLASLSGIAWAERDAPQELAAQIVELERRYGPWPEGYTSEWCPHLDAWWRSLATALGVRGRAVALVIDYGYPGHERHAPERCMGTLAGASRHHRVADPRESPGSVDWTAHVDFTQVYEAALAAGFAVLGYAPQGQFLLAAGLAEVFSRTVTPEPSESVMARSGEPPLTDSTSPTEVDAGFDRPLSSEAGPLGAAVKPDVAGQSVRGDTAPARAVTIAAQAVRALTLPGEMGEVFKVFCAGWNVGGDTGTSEAGQSWPADWPNHLGRLNAGSSRPEE
ncbi:MAG: class I SAM-dependent methyltransferase [Thioalkalivibrionaceae bacterium]